MGNLLLETEEVVEARVVHIAERPIPFERFLDLAQGRYVESVDGSDLRALEADYARLGVEELVFIPLRRQEIRLLHLRDKVYEETIITSGPVTFAAIEGLTLQAEWILQEPRPSVRATLNALLPSV
jgi:hypothetical protein